MPFDFRFYQPHILDYLKHGDTVDGITLSGQQWFAEAITQAACQIAEGYGCELHLSEQRLNEAHQLWTSDVSKMRIEDEGEADHFKHAGALAYWLRRRNVIEFNAEIPNRDGGKPQARFLDLGNEISAFLIGFRLALIFELEPGFETSVHRLGQISQIKMSQEFISDVAILLHQKNVSPHALYLIFRALFYQLHIPPAPGHRFSSVQGGLQLDAD